MDPLDSLHLQMRLEGKEVFRGLIRQVEIVPDEAVPLVLIAQLADGECIVYYDEAISPALRQDLGTGLMEIEFPDIVPLLNILARQGIRYEVGHYKTYMFPSFPAKDVEVSPFSKDDPKVKAFGFDGPGEHVYAIECDGRLVSACVSIRENEACGEAWVYTAPEYRRQGFAQKVVNAWARSLLEAGKIPFYSHKTDNRASANLARKLGLQPAFEEIVITRL